MLIAAQQQALTQALQPLQRSRARYGGSPGSICTMARVRQARRAWHGWHAWQRWKSITGRIISKKSYHNFKILGCITAKRIQRAAPAGITAARWGKCIKKYKLDVKYV